MKVLILISLLATTNLFAKEKTCVTIQDCVELVSKLTNKKYILDKSIKGSIKLSKNFKITKENAGDFISEVLSINGYTRIPSTKDQWTVINARDVRYIATPSYEHGKDEVPDNYDHAMVTIKLKNPYITSEISRNFRPFMSRYGRIIDIKDQGVIIINDTGKNIHRLLGLIKIIDQVPGKKEIKKYQRREKSNKKILQLKAQNCSDIKNDLNEIRLLLDN